MANRNDELDQRVIIPFSRKLLSQMEDYRYGRRIPSRAAAIRELIEAGLKTKVPRNPLKPQDKR